MNEKVMFRMTHINEKQEKHKSLIKLIDVEYYIF